MRCGRRGADPEPAVVQRAELVLPLVLVRLVRRLSYPAFEPDVPPHPPVVQNGRLDGLDGTVSAVQHTTNGGSSRWEAFCHRSLARYSARETRSTSWSISAAEAAGLCWNSASPAPPPSAVSPLLPSPSVLAADGNAKDDDDNAAAAASAVASAVALHEAAAGSPTHRGQAAPVP